MTDRFPYEDDCAWCQDPQQWRRWTDACEKTGVERVRDMVRQRVADGAGPWNLVKLWTGEHVFIGFCQAWLNCQEQQKGEREAERDRHKDQHEKGYRLSHLLITVAGGFLTAGVALVGWYLMR